jgi:branched-chain amino acid aminotransferase
MSHNIYPFVYFRGRYVPYAEAQLSICSAPFLYGLSVYSVLPVFWDKKKAGRVAFRLKEHFRRLQNSSKIVDFDTVAQQWDYPKFVTTISELLEKNNVTDNVFVRVTVFVDELMSGTRMYGLHHELAAFVYPMTRLLPEDGADLCVSSWQRIADNAIPARAKVNGSYVNSALMKNEALRAGYDDAIALDHLGHVAESTVSNIFLVRNNILITPSSSTDQLEGITRESVLDLSETLDIKTEKRSIDRSELYIADEIFLAGTSVGITPVKSVDKRLIGEGKIGPITKKVKTAYEKASQGNDPAFSSWCTVMNHVTPKMDPAILSV